MSLNRTQSGLSARSLERTPSTVTASALRRLGSVSSMGRSEISNDDDTPQAHSLAPTAGGPLRRTMSGISGMAASPSPGNTVRGTRARSSTMSGRMDDSSPGGANAMRKNKFHTFAAQPSIEIDGDTMDDLVEELPDMSELKYARFNAAGAEGGTVYTLSIRHLCTRSLNDGLASANLTVPIDTVTAIYDSILDDTSVFIRTVGNVKNMSERDYEQRLLTFENRTDREYFIAHLYTLAQTYKKPGDEENAVAISSWPGKMSSVADVKKNLATIAKQEKQKRKTTGKDTSNETAELLTTDQDYFSFAQTNPKGAGKIIEFGDKIIYFSSEAKTADNKHDVVIVTDQALYIGKEKKDVIRTRIPFDAIQGIAREDAAKNMLGGVGNAVTGVDNAEEVILVKLNFSKVALRSDLVIRFPTQRLRQQFEKIITRLYEEVVVDQLHNEDVGNLFWAKRGWAECQVLRLVGYFQSKRDTSDEDADGANADDIKSATKWLLWTFQNEPHVLVGSIAPCNFKQDDKQFIGRSLLSLARHLDTEEALLRCCVQYELFHYCGPIKPTCAVIPSTFLKENITNYILEEYCLGQTEQYTQILLGQIVEELAVDPTAADKDLVDLDALTYWVDAVLLKLYNVGRSPDVIPNELKTIIALINDIWVDAERKSRQLYHKQQQEALLLDGPEGTAEVTPPPQASPFDPYRLIGLFLFKKVLCPALEDPLQHGLVVNALNQHQTYNLSAVSKLLLAIGRFTISNTAGGLVQIDDALEYVQTQHPEMKDFLKDIIFTAYVGDHRAPEQISSSYDQIEQQVARIKVCDTDVKLLRAINRVLGENVGRLMNGAWCSAVRVKVVASGPADMGSRRGSVVDCERGRAGSRGPGHGITGDILDAAEDEENDWVDIGPPSSPRGSRRELKSSPTPQSAFDIGSKSATSAADAAELRKLRAENDLLKRQLSEEKERASRYSDNVHRVEKSASYYKEQLQHYRSELMRERGITDSDADDDDLLVIEKVLMRKRMKEMRKRNKKRRGGDSSSDSSSSSSGDSDDDLTTGYNDHSPRHSLDGSLTSSPKGKGGNRKVTINEDHNLLGNASFSLPVSASTLASSPNRGVSNPLGHGGQQTFRRYGSPTRPSDTPAVRGTTSPFSPQGGSIGGGVPRRPFGCPMDSHTAMFFDPTTKGSPGGRANVGTSRGATHYDL